MFLKQREKKKKKHCTCCNIILQEHEAFKVQKRAMASSIRKAAEPQGERWCTFPIKSLSLY